MAKVVVRVVAVVAFVAIAVGFVGAFCYGPYPELGIPALQPHYHISQNVIIVALVALLVLELQSELGKRREARQQRAKARENRKIVQFEREHAFIHPNDM